ncbi:MAG: metal-dependent transcriptional regulator [Coriobacteriales bacterium]|nr:metal-dependent transcriptional regulator [Coriobacteriales bacterium]
MPTPTLEEYLEIIYKLAERGTVKPTQLADAMAVSGPTVTATLKRLAERGLVVRKGTDVELTSEGESLAVDIVRRHRISEIFLVDILGLDWDVAHEEACRLEHALSPRVLEALEAYLNNPEVCPHGHPVPSSEGVVTKVVGAALADLPVGETGTVIRVAEDDEQVLSYLGELGLRPGTTVTVESAAPFGGPLTVKIGDAAEPIALARELGESIVVLPLLEVS